MLKCDEFVAAPRGRGRPGKGGPKRGSRRKVILSDGSVVRWWNDTWIFSKARWNSKAATSLQTRAMTIAVENGREVVDAERYTDFKKFSERMVTILGVDEFLKIVSWIYGVKG